MTIETLYNPQDTVFRMHNNKVVEDSIVQVLIKINKYADGAPVVEESYQLSIGGGGFKEYQFYRTKELLLQSL